MSEYPIGLKGEMIHCFDNSEYAQYCWSKLEQEVREEDLNSEEIEK